jgi:hypothetical protein
MLLFDDGESVTVLPHPSGHAVDSAAISTISGVAGYGQLFPESPLTAPH